LPYILNFLIGLQGPFKPLISINEYFDFIMIVLLGLGLVFELPVLIFFLALFNIVTPAFLWKNLRYAILIIAVVAAIITPTPDALTMLVFMAPMVGLYFIGIGVAALVVRNKAKRAAMAIARSYLVKTALFGEDANWGRIMAVLGSCGVDMDETRTDIFFGKSRLVEKGVAAGKAAEKEAAAALKQREVHLGIDLHKGKGEFTVWTCDLSYEYVKINAAYRS